MIRLSSLRFGPWELVSGFSDPNAVTINDNHGPSNQPVQEEMFKLSLPAVRALVGPEAKKVEQVFPFRLQLHWHQPITATCSLYLVILMLPQSSMVKINPAPSFNNTNIQSKLGLYSFNSRGFSADKQSFCFKLFNSTGDYLPILCNQENFL